MIFEWLSPPIVKRQAEFLQNIYEKLTILEEQFEEVRPENLVKNPVFLSTLAQANRMASVNHQKTKLECLRNAVLNSALPGSPDENLQAIFLQYIDRLTELHLKILAFYHDPKRVMTEMGTIDRVHYNKETLIPYLMITYPELKEQELLVVVINKELVDLGLVNNTYLTKPTNRNTIFAGSATPFGSQFMDFIKNPQPLAKDHPEEKPGS